jgi:hypothetical protein
MKADSKSSEDIKLKKNSKKIYEMIKKLLIYMQKLYCYYSNHGEAMMI